MDIYIPRIPPVAIEVLALAAVIVGFWRGGRDARIFAALILYQMFRLYLGRADPTAYAFFHSVPFYYLEGLALLAVCGVGLLRARAYWTVWATAAVLLSTVTDLLELAIDLSMWAFFSAHIAWFILLCASVLAGSLLRSGQGGAGRRGQT